MTARMMATAVSTLSISLFGLVAATLTTCPVTATGPEVTDGAGPADGTPPARGR